MTTSPILPTGRASLCALGEYRRRRCCFAPRREQVTIPQKTVRYRPLDKIREALGGLRCGAKTMAQSNVTIRPDPAGQRALGRTGCADQSTIARTLRACPVDPIAQLARVSWYELKRYGAPPHHRFDERLRGVDVAVTPLPSGATAEGSARTWRGRHRSQTGRTTLRITASQDRERRHETLRRGTEPAVPACKAALQEVATPLEWSRARRAQIGLRMAGGFGTTEILHGLRSRGSQGVAKIRHSGRVPKVCQPISPWPPPSSPGRKIATRWRPHRCGRATRQGGMRTPQEKGGSPSAIRLTTVPDLAPTGVAEAYDGRAMIEATLCQEKQALGLGKRRQHTWEAPQGVLLFARLAPQRLLGRKRWRSRVPSPRWRLPG